MDQNVVQGYVDDDGNAGLLATYGPTCCDCEIIGNGTLPHPLSIKYCEKHRIGTELISICGCVLDDAKARCENANPGGDLMANRRRLIKEWLRKHLGDLIAPISAALARLEG